ncbi:hypothetical protein ACIBQ6_21995 [Nonomuraea sp. NPDC049655]|uniref:hypothetical protein n=1 Tax=Nonomuraea sp. NPDC049655 TaxID=3364355 RepID=UPI00378F434A
MAEDLRHRTVRALADPQWLSITRGHEVRERPDEQGNVQVACECGAVVLHRMLVPGDSAEFMRAVKRHARRDNVRWSE